MKAYSPLVLVAGALPATERGCAEVLSLPLYPGLPDGAVERVAKALIRA